MEPSRSLDLKFEAKQRLEKANLSQVKKCNQIWDKMPQTHGGRLCNKCAKTIIDFRNASPQKIAETHAFSDAPVCGLYTKKQLEIPTRPILKNTNKSVFWFSIAGLFVTHTAQSQVKKELQQTEQTQPESQTIQKELTVENKQQSTMNDSLIVYGQVKNDFGEPVPFANVIVKETNLGCTTDYDGNFRLAIPHSQDSTQFIVLVFSYVGYARETVRIDMNLHKKNTSLKLDQVLFNEDSAVAFGVTIQAPTPWYKRPFVWIKNLFN